MKRITNASLKHLNSFSVEARASRLFQLNSDEDLQDFISESGFDEKRDVILGGGSNILFAGDVDGSVVLNRITGKKIIEDSGDEVLVQSRAGENWHQLVLWCLGQGLSGIENLALIPGLAGAAPMQNIGAYGVELADILHSVQTIELKNGQARDFKQSECQFRYRDSRFKSADAGKYLITGIRLHLHRNFRPNLAYKGLEEELLSTGIRNPTAKQVCEAVIRIRQRKLPDPNKVGNAGSFFKNPVVDRKTAGSLSREFPGLPVHFTGDNAKLSAAWMIEHCNWKGRSIGGAAVSEKHALVLINKGDATGDDILALAGAIQDSVQKRFAVELQPEPKIIR